MEDGGRSWNSRLGFDVSKFQREGGDDSGNFFWLFVFKETV